MCKRLLIGLAFTVVLGLSGMPAVAQATPRWFINGQLAEAKHEGVAGWGELTFENHFIGKTKCDGMMYGRVFNKGETGLGEVENLTTFACTSEPVKCSGTFLSDEKPVAVRTVEGKTKAVREPGSLPWPEELTETEKQKRLIIKPLLTVVMPCLNLEIPFQSTAEQHLEPAFVNGIGNGMSPSHLQFGKTTKIPCTICLTTTALSTSEEDNIGYLIGELTQVGPNVELITAE